MENKGETLVIVPCWWDNSPESLIATIRLQRKDLFPNASPLATPIPPEPPPGFFKVVNIPGVGELMLSMFADSQSLLAQKDWWMSEKYDGVRACWNPTKKILYARRGYPYSVLPSFSASLPSCYTDGELWFGRRTFKESQKLTSKNPEIEIEWPSLRYVAFDNPSLSSQLLPFEERFSSLLASVCGDSNFIIAATHVRNLGTRHVTRYTSLIIDNQGEGVMIRQNKSPYESGRSQFLQKYKASREDLEALVLEAQGGSHYLIRFPSGDKMTVPLSPDYAGIRPTRGDLVTLSYTVISSRGMPGDPKIERVRDDVTWTDEVSPKLTFAEYSQKAFTNSESPSTRAPFGYWTDHDGQNVRAFFEHFARSKNFDPLNPANWYRFVKEDYLPYKGAYSLFKHHQSSVVRALFHAFPGIGLRENQFRHVSRKHWSNLDNRRAVFEQIADKYGFDALVAKNWYTFSTDDIQAEKGGNSVLFYYNHSLSKALMSLFPEVPFVLSKFKNFVHGYWKSRQNRKDFFDSYAKKLGFDPLIASNWYSVSHDDIAAEKGGGTILHLYRSSLMKAVVDIYPEVKFDKSEFGVLNRKTYHVSNMRKLFDSFARAQGWDPLVTENWYEISPEMLQEDKMCANLLQVRFKGNLVQALSEIYPDLRLQHHKFTKISSKNSWRLEGARRRFFTSFAESRGFDPLMPEGWDGVTRDEILAKGGRRALDYHKGSLHQALEDLFNIRKEVFYKNL
eukprot:Phypoly_transcript_03006.p1 GENE.Phypoly_transcript_03006~~Phypoly_transcript_03006.p1  ORF type:complete len:734 (+),score=100.03 Phypoly_transcript_03006:377-2578(+)